MKKLTTILFILLVSALALTACGQQAVATISQPTVLPPGAVVAEGHIRPIQASSLAFQARGVVNMVNVKIGDQVKANDLLVSLANAGQARAALIAAQQAYNLVLRNAGGDRAKAWQVYMSAQKVRGDALNKWNNLDVKDIENRMKEQQNVVDQRQKDLTIAQAEFDKYKDKPVNNFDRSNASDKLVGAQENLDEANRKLDSITRERDTIRAALDAAIGAEAEAKHQYELFTNDNPNADQLVLAKAQVDSAQSALSNYELRAPFDGVVADVNVHVGDQIGPETSAVSVADFNQWMVETSDVTELEVVKLAVGQTVTMVPDALPGVTINGTVESISQAFTKQGGDILYTVRIKVDKVDPRIRWGMTLEVTFPPNQ
ncbi:MAG: efflux RND transporter periplasmic adaptor subunit [Chloroflexi bacterium]|nr:efflux RND transporter periplasmic adaptor subunit [Chloroflexota bacterium]